MSRYTIGIDIGTTGTKTVLFDTERGIVAQASREATLYSPNAGWAEADPAQWLANIIDSIQQLLAESSVDASEIGALATSGMVPAVILVGDDGAPVGRALLQNDARANDQVDRLAGQLTDLDLVALTGSALTQQSVAPTIRWFHENRPEDLAAARFIVGSYDWVLMALGAEPHVELNWALESGLFTIAGEPVPQVFAAAGLDADLVPPVQAPGSVVGSVSASIAERTGLRTGTTLVVGGADHVLSAFAAGVEKHGDWLVKLGGAGDILVASDTPIVDQRLYLDAHPVPGRWLPNGCMATSGSLIRWYQGLIGGESLAQLDIEATESRPAEVLCLPYFLGEKSPLHDPDLRGTFAGLHLGNTRADLYRSVLEAIAFGFRHHVEVFRDMGIELGRVSITNGGSKSTLWKQIHSEVLGTEMFPVVDHPGASLGAALIAAVGIGSLDDWSDTARFITLGSPVVPDPHKVEIYDRAYLEWRELGAAVAPISHKLARRTRQ
ncbi:FGGY-family carbohydrate kinase [Amnibacterium flavum]|uniref:Carbohydrate kinase n=1 Tax=Amnibacterium flavum TaxID=2173173 RepID=A0A2V1HRX9_9MICO|nr:FGGY-family carbohydrate kinase [Amnibacterium flavum]PVZ95308.1 carbohydrate kinase [Amnibacterium flavum]